MDTCSPICTQSTDLRLSLASHHQIHFLNPCKSILCYHIDNISSLSHLFIRFPHAQGRFTRFSLCCIKKDRHAIEKLKCFAFGCETTCLNMSPLRPHGRSSLNKTVAVLTWYNIRGVVWYETDLGIFKYDWVWFFCLITHLCFPSAF